MHEEIMLAPGVYVTDFRKDATLTGLQKSSNPLTNDVGLLLDLCHSNESKCKMLQFSIGEIKGEEGWEEDRDFVEAVEDNWKVIVRLSRQMKEAVLKLAEVKYKPESQKMEELLDFARIEAREARAQEQVDIIAQAAGERAEEAGVEKEPARVDQDEEQEGVYL